MPWEETCPEIVQCGVIRDGVDQLMPVLARVNKIVILMAAAAALVSLNTQAFASHASSQTARNRGCAPQLGVHVGIDPAALTRFETWLGRPVDGVRVASGDADWNDYDSSISWLAGVWSGSNRPIYWSIPLIPRVGADLGQA